MRLNPISDVPEFGSYDVVIVGGAIMGASVAWFLANHPGFQGRVLVVERDHSYEHSSTAHSNSCMRQQFSSALNVRISQYGARYVADFRAEMGGDARVPELHRHHFGYLYLAGDDAHADALAGEQEMQAALGAGTCMMTPDALGEAFPFMDLTGIVAGSFNTRDEGYFDGGSMFDWWRRMAREKGVEYLRGEVAGVTTAAGRVTHAVLADGTRIACGTLVNAAGPRAALVADMAGLTLPVEPRKRFTYVVEAAKPLAQDLPLTVDPSGVHIRTDGANYMVGAAPDPDPAVDPDDLAEDHSLWENHVWPIIAGRIPQFDQLKVLNSWAGHYAYNTVDQNAVIGPHPEMDNFMFINGFSGHGLQQAPAMGRGLAEWIVTGRFMTLDLSDFGFTRLLTGGGGSERAVI